LDSDRRTAAGDWLQVFAAIERHRASQLITAMEPPASAAAARWILSAACRTRVSQVCILETAVLAIWLSRNAFVRRHQRSCAGPGSVSTWMIITSTHDVREWSLSRSKTLSNKTLISRPRWYRRTLPLAPRRRCKTLHPYTQFSRNVRLISSTNHDFFGASWLFWLLRLINTLAYLLTEPCLVDNIYGSFKNNMYIVQTHFFIKRPTMLQTYCNYSSIMHHFRVIWRWTISRPWNLG